MSVQFLHLDGRFGNGTNNALFDIHVDILLDIFPIDVVLYNFHFILHV